MPYLCYALVSAKILNRLSRDCIKRFTKRYTLCKITHISRFDSFMGFVFQLFTIQFVSFAPLFCCSTYIYKKIAKDAVIDNNSIYLCFISIADCALANHLIASLCNTTE